MYMAFCRCSSKSIDLSLMMFILEKFHLHFQDKLHYKKYNRLVKYRSLAISACLYLQMLIPFCKPTIWELVCAVQMDLSRCIPDYSVQIPFVFLSKFFFFIPWWGKV